MGFFADLIFMGFYLFSWFCFLWFGFKFGDMHF